MNITGMDGVLRIYDASRIIPDVADMSVIVYDDSLGAWTEKATEAQADDTDYTGVMLAEADDAVYVGCASKFAMFTFLQGSGALAVAAGALTVKYYNGSLFAAVEGMVDGTASGGHTFAQDGEVSFEIPSDWAMQGNVNLDADKYYVQITCASVPTTAPSADILAPVDGQYYEVPFGSMDFSGPMGRPKAPQILVLDRGRMNANAHYVKGPDDVIHEPLEISYSALIDAVLNRIAMKSAMACDNPGSTNWASTGTDTKGTTKNDGVNYNPGFADSDEKTVNVQMLWITSTKSLGYAYYEVLYPEDQQNKAESPENLVLSTKGASYGVIEPINAFGIRY